jgi:CubicO group peptidase (beta-lactamase class C family)
MRRGVGLDRRVFLSAAAACSVSASSARFAGAQTLHRFGEAARYSADRNGAALIVVRHGVVLAEDYPGGPAATRWPIGAGTRAFTPLLAASLIADDLMTLDEPVALTIGDWGAHPVKATISMRALLSGASGVGFGRGAHTLAAAIAAEPADAPGVRFIDDEAAYLIFVEVARRKLLSAGREPDPARYLTTRTLLPIGCVPIGWLRGEDGAPRFDTGAAVSARGWAQAGELIRREGVWRAQQLADPYALREAVRGSFAEARAGFGLWLAAPGRFQNSLAIDTDLWNASSPAPTDLAMAAGAGGQRLYLSPSEGIVVARLSRSPDDHPWSDAQFLSLVWRDLERL